MADFLRSDRSTATYPRWLAAAATWSVAPLHVIATMIDFRSRQKDHFGRIKFDIAAWASFIAQRPDTAATIIAALTAIATQL